MKGIILAGGNASRLYPTTRAVSKQLLPVYDKPMIYYPLSTLMLAGIRDILLICKSKDTASFRELFDDGSSLGIRISYAVQDEPRGIAEAFIIGEDFIGREGVCLILGDNLFFGNQLSQYLQQAAGLKGGAEIFAYNVKDPERYGVVGFDQNQKPVSIIEKPKRPASNWAVTGIYFFDHKVVEIAKGLKPSRRGEIEISDVCRNYLNRGKLRIQRLGRGFAWLDTGTCDSLIDAAMFIKTIEERQGMKIGCVEEIAFRMKFIGRQQLQALARGIKTDYGRYLEDIGNTAL